MTGLFRSLTYQCDRQFRQSEDNAWRYLQGLSEAGVALIFWLLLDQAKSNYQLLNNEFPQSKHMFPHAAKKGRQIYGLTF